jgi:DNA-directed RNA polymerase subunit RPC12/RpoP
MVKKSVGFVHMEWSCPNCSSRNPGTNTICGNCSAAQPDDVHFHQAADQSLIEDDALIKRAQAGPDVHCAFCGTRNPATAVQCSQCFADLTDAQARSKGGKIGAHSTKKVADVECPYCSTMNAAANLQCTNCNSPLPSVAQKQQVESQTSTQPARPQRRTNPLIFIVLVIAVIACGVFYFLSIRTEELIGRVSDVSWTRTVNIEALGPVEYEGWLDEIPAGGAVGLCREEVKYTSGFPEPNSQEVCGTPYTVDTGTGVGEVVQECEYLVYDELCAYTVEEWQVVGQASESGQGFSPIWPIPQLNLSEREGTRDEVYEVLFETDGRSYAYQLDNFNEFERFDIGSRWILEVNALNAIRSLSPAN